MEKSSHRLEKSSYRLFSDGPGLLFLILGGRYAELLLETFGEIGGGIESYGEADFADPALVLGEQLGRYREPLGPQVVVRGGVEQRPDLADQRRAAQKERLFDLFAGKGRFVEVLHDQFVDPAQEFLVGAVQPELFGIERLLRVLVAFFQPGALVQNGPDAGFEIVEPERFFKIGAGSGFHACDLRRRVRDGRCYDDGDVREIEIRADRAAEFDAVRAGQGDVRDDDVHLLFLQYGDGLFGRVYGDDPIVGGELVFEIGREFPVVLHEQQQR